MNFEGVNGVLVVFGSFLLLGVWVEWCFLCFFGEIKFFGWDVDLVCLCLIVGELLVWIIFEGVLKFSLERKGVFLNIGILGVK